MSTGNQGKQKQATFAEQLAAGTQKHLANAGQLTFAGGTFTPAQVIDRLESFGTLRSDADAAKAVAKAKVAAERAQLPALREFLLAFVAVVKAQFGASPDILADFGIQPKKARKPLTAEQKAAANAKRQATRKARGVIGKVNRAKVKGDVTGVTITPVHDNGQQPAQQPASNGSNGGNAK